MVARLLLLSLLFLGCARGAPPTPTRTPAVHQTPSQKETPPGSELRERYSILLESGKPHQILDEFSKEELVISADALFEHKVKRGNLQLYSDRPFEQENGLRVLDEVHRRLSASPLYQEGSHSAFICNDQWKASFFLQSTGRLGGLNHFPIAPHVFLTTARVDDDALISPRGRPIAHPRTLTYYVAHEFAHTLVGRHLGETNWWTVPKWLFEGYPDYVGLGPEYNYDVALKAYLQRDPRVPRNPRGGLLALRSHGGLRPGEKGDDHSRVVR